MKSSKLITVNRQCSLLSLAWLLAIILLLMPSCQKEEYENGMVTQASLMNATLKNSANTIIYYGSETFKIVARNEPFFATRTLTNPYHKYFEKFILKVKNGNGNSNKDVKLEIRIDDVVIMTSADFIKGENIILKELTGLTPESILEIRLEGNKNKSITLLIECYLQEDVITDIDGNYYHTVKIGEHWYTAENLRVTRFNDGTPIPLVEENEAWSNLWIINTNRHEYELPNSGWPAPAYCWYNNDPSNKDIYGALYTASVAVSYYNVKDRVEYFGNVCPVGWHVRMPVEIFNGVEGNWDKAGLYKEAGTEHWASPNTGATNSTGFTALPGGFRGYGQDGVSRFWYMGYRGTWWTGHSAYHNGENGGTFIHMQYDDNYAIEDISYMDGKSIRCMKDF